MLLCDILMDVNIQHSLISNTRIKTSNFFWRRCAFLPPFSFRTPCWSWRGWHYSDQLVAVWVAVMGVVLGVSIQGDPHLLTVSQSSPLCSLSIWPCHGGTEWQIGTEKAEAGGEWVAYPLGNRHCWNPCKIKSKIAVRCFTEHTAWERANGTISGGVKGS